MRLVPSRARTTTHLCPVARCDREEEAESDLENEEDSDIADDHLVIGRHERGVDLADLACASEIIATRSDSPIPGWIMIPQIRSVPRAMRTVCQNNIQRKVDAPDRGIDIWRRTSFMLARYASMETYSSGWS